MNEFHVVDKSKFFLLKGIHSDNESISNFLYFNKTFILSAIIIYILNENWILS